MRHAHASRIAPGIAAFLLLSACASTPAPEAAPSSQSSPSAPAAPAAPAQVGFTPDASFKVCPQITASNAPTIDADRNIIGYTPFARVQGVRLAVSPTRGGCLTSGFGQRGGGLHKGIDIQTKPASMIHAAAGGLVLEAGFRADYGNYVVIDHGSGVYTRYAHLVEIMGGVAEGVRLNFGAPLGVMGATAAYAIPIHLHYEVLTGTYNTPKKSFGLTPVEIFDHMSP